MTYNAITYIPVFVSVVYFAGFRLRFSLLNFVPYSLFVFTIWRVPAVKFADPVTDKMAVSLAMLIVFLARFPYSLLVVGTSALRYYLWTYDLLKIRKVFVPVPNALIDRDPAESAPLDPMPIEEDS